MTLLWWLGSCLITWVVRCPGTCFTHTRYQENDESMAASIPYKSMYPHPVQRNYFKVFYWNWWSLWLILSSFFFGNFFSTSVFASEDPEAWNRVCVYVWWKQIVSFPFNFSKTKQSTRRSTTDFIIFLFNWIVSMMNLLDSRPIWWGHWKSKG